MLELIKDAGWGAWPVLLLAIGGLAATLTVGRARKRPGSVAAAFAVAVLAAGALGTATGQKAVQNYLETHKTDKLDDRVDALAEGTREAQTNLLLAGAGAMVLMAVGGGLALAQRE